jgi:hypothetical protein
MNQIEKIIRDNQEEFLTMVIEFVNQKAKQEETKPKPKQKKSPKTVCYFNVLGKTYNEDVFTKNYSKFLNDISNLHDFSLFKRTMRNFVKLNMNDFPKSTTDKTCVIKLSNGGLVSCNSSTQIKMNHIKNICNELNVPVTFTVE